MPFRKKQETTRPFTGVRRTTCANCPAGCGLKVYVKDGALVDIFGDEDHPVNKGSVCPKGLLNYYHLTSPARLTRPQVRDDLSQPFRTVSFGEAVAFTAEKLEKVVADRGRESVVVHGAETDPFDHLAAGTLFARALGSPFVPGRFFPAPFGAGGAIDRMFGLPAARLQANTPRDWCNSRLILLYRSDLAATDPISFGPVLDARDRGATLLSLDDRGGVTASKATVAVRVRPGTQSVFLRGVLGLLIARGAVDQEFIADWTDGFEAFAARLAAFGVEAVSRTCEVEPAEIERFAQLIAKARPVQVIAGDWHSRRFLGDDDLAACAALVCLKGSLGIPGGGLNLLGVSPFSFLDEREAAAGNLALERLLGDDGANISALFCHGDACSRLAGGADVQAAFARTPLVVSLASYPNRTQAQAHVVIPVSCPLEYDGLLAFNNGRAVQIHRKVVEPPGDCHSPLDFWTALARVLGLCAPALAEAEQGAAAFCDRLLGANPLTRALCFADLDPEAGAPGGVLWPCTERSDLALEDTRYVKGTVRGTNILFQRNRNFPGSETRFPTPSGRIDFPDSEPPGETSAEAQTHPLLLVTGARVDCVEQFGPAVADGPVEDLLFAKVNPRLALALGVKSGDPLVVENARGQLRLPARLSEDVAPGVVWLPDCAHPLSLFEMPEAGAGAAPFARVTAYSPGQDREAARRAVLDLLWRHDAEAGNTKAGGRS